MIPIIRPKVAPIAIDGTNMPAGTLHPYDIITKKIRNIVARRSDMATDHCTEVLQRYSRTITFWAVRFICFNNLLAQIVIISTTFAFTKEDRHHLGHVNSQEAVEVPNHCSQGGKTDSLHDWVVRKVLSTERHPLEIEFDHKGAVESLCRE